jgi:predicted RNA-binding Zn-ribbon protein involved in translation (DUF1610 family)
MDSKKVVIMVVLVVVIVIAVVLLAKRTGNEPAPVLAAANDQVQMVDMKSLEVFTESSNDWAGKYKPDASGHYKNPKTGEYTVAQGMKCASCGQLIPVPEIPPDQLPPPATKEPGEGRGNKAAIRYARAKQAVLAEVLRNYKCPRCGKSATTAEGGAAAPK